MGNNDLIVIPKNRIVASLSRHTKVPLLVCQQFVENIPSKLKLSSIVLPFMLARVVHFNRIT
jgi:hypothetical protein